MKTGIYQIINTINNNSYIGSTVDFKRRFRQHKFSLRKNKILNRYLQNAWNKYGENCFEFKILEYCSENQLLEREQFYIDTVKPIYNLRKIAESNRGFKWSEEQKLRQSISHKGKPSPKKGIKTNKPSWNKGIPMKEEVRLKMVGRKLSEETKRKIGRKGEVRKPTIPILCKELNKVFNSIAEAARFLGNVNKCSNINACANGKQKTAYGYTWEFIRV